MKMLFNFVIMNISDDNVNIIDSEEQENLNKMKEKIKKNLGRPSKFYPEIIEEMLDYFFSPGVIKTLQIFERIWENGGGHEEIKKQYKNQGADLPTFSTFALTCGLDEDTLINWANKGKELQQKSESEEEINNGFILSESDENYIKFFGAYRKCKEIQHKIWQDNTLKGLYKDNFAIFIGKNIFRDKGYKDEIINKNYNYDMSSVLSEAEERFKD